METIKHIKQRLYPVITVKTGNFPELDVQIDDNNDIYIKKVINKDKKLMQLNYGGIRYISQLSGCKKFYIENSDVFICGMSYFPALTKQPITIYNKNNKTEFRGLIDDLNKEIDSNFIYTNTTFVTKTMVIGEKALKFNIKCEELDIVLIHSYRPTHEWYKKLFENLGTIQCNVIKFLDSALNNRMKNIIKDVKTKKDFIRIFNIDTNKINFEHFIISSRQIF